MVHMVLILVAGLIFNGCSTSSNVPAETDYHVIPFRTIGKRIPLISAQLNNKRAWFIVDTGASITLLNETEAEYFGFSMYHVNHDVTEMRGFSSKLKLSRTSFCNIEIGPLKVGKNVYRSQDMNGLFRIIEN